jgi:hypothetical protein
MNMGKFKPRTQFNKNHWNHLHDCWFHVKGTKPTQKQLESIFDELPGDLKFLADRWGMNATEFREGVIEWMLANHFTEK